MTTRKYRHLRQPRNRLAPQRVNLADRIHHIAKKLQPNRRLLVISRKYLDRVAPHPKRPAMKVEVVPLILQLDELAQQHIAPQLFTLFYINHHAVIRLRRAEAIDTAHRRHDDHVVARQQRIRRRVPHPINLFVDVGGLLDKRITRRHIRFRLVVVVVRDEVFDRVFGEKLLKLAVKLRCKRLVRRQHQCRAIHLGHHARNRKRLPSTRRTQQHLMLVTPQQPLGQLANRVRLVTLRRLVGHKLKRTRKPLVPPTLKRRHIRLRRAHLFHFCLARWGFSACCHGRLARLSVTRSRDATGTLAACRD